jgi:hypothetical protein
MPVIAGGPRKDDGTLGVVNYSTNWTDFRKWIDGSCGRLVYTWSEDAGGYTVLTLDQENPRRSEIAKSSPASADQTDFETNWKKLAYSPGLQLNADGMVTCVAPKGQEALSGVEFGQIVTAATTRVQILGTTYTEQTVDGQRSISSSSANDRTASTGAKTVKITYYDQNMNGPYVETVALNGATAVVTTATNICFIESLEVASAGSGRINAGAISLYANTSGNGTVIASIAAGAGRTLFAHHHVPAGRAVYITQVTASVTASAALVTLVRRGLTENVDLPIGDALRPVSTNASVIRTYQQPICVTGPARVVMFTTPAASTSLTTYGSFDYYEV